jgi:hypothetical protein
MPQFKDFGIKTDMSTYVGDKIKMSKVLNREITVLKYKIEESKFGVQGTQRMCLQIELAGVRHIIFTNSRVLRDMIERVPQEGFPFTTIIIENNERFEFT